MSIFSSPASVAAKPEPQEDPAIKAQREAIAADTAAQAEKTAETARRRFEGRTMGTQGANALFTGGAQGYAPASRTMGSANL